MRLSLSTAYYPLIRQCRNLIRYTAANVFYCVRMTEHFHAGRLTLTITLPALLLSLVTGVALYLDFENTIEEQQRLYGEATASQLSEQFAAHLVEEDVLSINVLAKRFADTEQLAFIAVYDSGNNLQAQSGKESRGTRSFTREITFQDSLVGFIHIVLNDAPGMSPILVAIWLLLLIIICTAAFFLAAPLRSWFLVTTSDAGTEQESAPVEPVLLIPEGPVEECILVVRIRPARYMENHFDKFFEAAGLYQGIVEQTTTEELVIHFEGPDASFRATCAGLLIQKLAGHIGGSITFGGTLNLVGDDPEKVRKAASYLASISEGELLLAGEASSISERAELQAFHHSLVDSKDVRRVTSVVSQAMLENQAEELFAS
jgi:hypothetical protein